MKLIKLIYWTVQGYVDAKMGLPSRTLNRIHAAGQYFAYNNGYAVAKGREI